MSRVAHILQAIAAHEVERRPGCELATVTSVFDGDDGPDTHTISVELKDSGVPLPRVPVASMLTGAAALPRVGDVVLVAFPRGELSGAIAIAQVYSDERRPPSFKRDEVALVWPGDTDDPDAGAVELRVRADGSAREVLVSLGGDKDARVSLTDGKVELVSGGVTVSLGHSSSSDGEIEIAAGGTRLKLSQDGDLQIEAQGKLVLKGSEVAIEGNTKVSVNGQTVEIN